MAIEAQIIEDSAYQRDDAYHRLTTFLLKYPRFIHAELMTHRVFSRNASSSRAIPIMTQLWEIIRDPAHPVFWGANRPGMQARDELDGWRLWLAQQIWFKSRYFAVFFAFIFYHIGLHKQIGNRILEPWAHITVVLTSTEYRNWFALRSHKDAQPEIKALSDKMRDLYYGQTPEIFIEGDGKAHLPFVTSAERSIYGLDDLIKMSVARCARTSYKTHDKRDPKPAEDFKLHDRLVNAVPPHLSPTEHQGLPDHRPTATSRKLYGNFNGWMQYRGSVEGKDVA